MNKAGLVAALLLVPLLAGCANPFAKDGPVIPYTELEGYRRDTSGNDPNAWPDLEGEALVILDNGAFPACTAPTGASAKEIFEKLTKVKVTCQNGGDTGSALKKLVDAKRGGTYDIIYGLDNALLAKAEDGLLLEAYKPKLADRIPAKYLFFGAQTSAENWTATPVDHGYVALNIDQGFTTKNGTRVFTIQIDSLAKVLVYSDQFVTPDPSVSSPGLAFLLTTIAKYGDKPAGSPFYDWHAYWRDLFRGTARPGAGSDPCVLIAKDWTDAYSGHFSGGYGVDSGGLGDKPIVTSYTTSPAYEAFYGRNATKLARIITESDATWHQIQTMAIANGTKHPQAAQAWIEFTLTDKFQELAAPQNAVYPIVESISVEETFGGLDPTPGSFKSATLDYELVGANLDRWLKEWRALSEDAAVNCRAT